MEIVVVYCERAVEHIDTNCVLCCSNLCTEMLAEIADVFVRAAVR